MPFTVATDLPFLIAGAGISGLTTALALAAVGCDVMLFERAGNFSEVGAGLQLSPNATRVLARLGVLEQLRPTSTLVRSIDLVSARTGSGLLSLNTDKTSGGDTAPFLAVHRADLQTVLLEKVKRTKAISVMTGHEFSGACETASGVEIEFLVGGHTITIEGAALIGADGVWSRVRALVAGSATAKHAGFTAWRGSVDANADLPPALARTVRESRVTAFLAPGAHLVAYPLRGGSLVNLVLVTPGTAPSRGYDNPVDLQLLQAVLGEFEPGLAELLAAIPDWRSWPLFACAPNGNWTQGRIALAGDAAHAMTPFAAQGACMAIEDAAVLARCVAANPSAIEAAFSAYEAKRKSRLVKVVARGRFNRFAYHLSGPAAVARNMVFNAVGQRLMARLGWLYEIDVYAD